MSDARRRAAVASERLASVVPDDGGVASAAAAATDRQCLGRANKERDVSANKLSHDR
jgi:hypothetical protein